MRIVFTVLIAALVALRVPALADETFQTTSPAFKDGDVLTATYAFRGVGRDGTECGGKNVSPPLAWANAPAKTQSFAVVIFDVDGFNGLGVAHWVGYNLPPGKTSLAENEAATASFTLGKNVDGEPAFRGFCPPKGQSLHHYVMSVYALDLPPSLPPGLTRADLLAAMDKHILRSSSIVGRYVR